MMCAFILAFISKHRRRREILIRFFTVSFLKNISNTSPTSKLNQFHTRLERRVRFDTLFSCVSSLWDIIFMSIGKTHILDFLWQDFSRGSQMKSLSETHTFCTDLCTHETARDLLIWNQRMSFRKYQNLIHIIHWMLTKHSVQRLSQSFYCKILLDLRVIPFIYLFSSLTTKTFLLTSWWLHDDITLSFKTFSQQLVQNPLLSVNAVQFHHLRCTMIIYYNYTGHGNRKSKRITTNES